MPDWYIICNPTSGGGISKKKLSKIFSALEHYKLSYQFIKTEYPHQEEELVIKAIEKGFNQLICIGGDGTIHHMINGIMKQNYMQSNHITFAVIPSGTGNDWVKNYGIPNHPKKAVELIHKKQSVLQDIGIISFRNNQHKVYFNNAAGIGYDAFVVKNINRYKKWGSLAYILAALQSFKNFKAKKISYKIDGALRESYIFLISLGICKFSGGGMQLTNYKEHKNGNFDLTIIKSISFKRIIAQLTKLYNGKIASVREANCFHIKNMELIENKSLYIQADGELIGKGNPSLEILPKALKCVISKKI